MARLPRDRWIAELKDFTYRNAAREVVVEEDAPDLGAQREVSRYDLRGVAYDPRDDRIEIMMSHGPVGHMTRSIGAPIALDLAPGADPREEVLRIEHDGGQTLLHVLKTRGA
ncbi:MAG TPA: DUF5335 family protein [Longimicrobiales bacterium]|nr:DUF5335 family protein [Longimicrobiales bacterium]